MKKYKNILFTVLTACVFMLGTSCTEDDDRFIVTDTAPVLLADLIFDSIELDLVNTNNPAVTFKWSEANYGQQVPVTYKVEVASNALFTNATTLASVNSNTSVTLSVTELNVAAGNVGLPPFAWNDLYARVSSSVGTAGTLPVASNSIKFSVYPYFNYIFNDYFLVGNGTAANWNNNNNNPPLFRDGENPNLYFYTGYFTNPDGGIDNGRFKILDNRGSWSPQWGVSDNEGSDVIRANGTIAGNPVTQAGDPGRFGVASNGYYAFSINFSTRRYTMETFNASGATNFSSIEIQGTSTTTKPMTRSTFDSHIWYINSTPLVSGTLQFKTNTGSVWAGSTAFSGRATLNGGNIPVVVQDDYEVWFNDLTGHYIMIPLNL